MKNVFILVLLTAIFAVANAQQAEQVRTSRIDIRLSAAPITTPRYAQYAFPTYDPRVGWYATFPERDYWKFRVEGNYQIYRFLQVGVWTSYGFISRGGPFPSPTWDMVNTHVVGGGIRAGIQLLPLFFERFREREPRVNVFVSAELGGFYFINTLRGMSVMPDPLPDPRVYGGGHRLKAIGTVGLGLSIAVNERLSVFYDPHIGGFLGSQATSFPRFGLIVKL